MAAGASEGKVKVEHGAHDLPVFSVRTDVPKIARAPLSEAMSAHLAEAATFYACVPEGAAFHETRAAYDAMSRHFSGRRPAGISIHDTTIPRPPETLAHASPLGLRIYRSQLETSSLPSPAVLYLHGGGFALGDLESHDTIAADLCAKTGVSVVAVDYARVPEFQFPAALEDTLTAWHWLGENAKALNIDATRMAVGGDSCGATLAANLAHVASANSCIPPPAGQLLIYPVLGIDFDTCSYLANAAAPNLTRDDMIACWTAYLPSDIDAQAKSQGVPNLTFVSPGLAPAAILTAAHDPVCDDGSVYATRLGHAGIPTAFRCDARLPHGHLRARHADATAADAFDWVCAALQLLVRGRNEDCS
ncbi:MAG: alpha/beta hydrolase [Pseudomonadota bacterium]